MATDKPVGTSLSSIIKRIIWFCMLPLFLFAAGMTIYQINILHKQQVKQAAIIAENVAFKIDNSLRNRISALEMLAFSPLIDDLAEWEKLYQQAQGFYKIFNNHVVITDGQAPSPQLLMNTRVPLGTRLPKVEAPKGRLAGPIAMQTGKPAVSDLFLGVFRVLCQG